MVDQTGINAITAPLASALCTLGLVIASRHKLKRWIAISQLLPPAPASDEEIAKATPPTPAGPVVKGWRRFFTKRMMKQYLFIILYMGVQFAIIFGLPRISSRLFLDCFFGTMMFALIVFSFGMVSTVLFPTAANVVYERKTAISGLTIKDDNIHPEPPYNWVEHTRTLNAVVWASSIFIWSYLGYTVLQPLATASWLTMTIAGLGWPKMRVKRIVQVLMGATFGIPFITAILVPIFVHFFGDAPPNHPSRGVASPSDWILSILPMCVQGIPFLYPGVLLAMMLRFDHSRSNSSVSLRSSEPIVVPTKLDAFPSPLFNAGLFALSTLISTSLAFKSQLSNLCKNLFNEDCADFWIMVGSVILPVCAVAFRAWSLGILREWWEYEEAWIPNKAEVAAILMDNAEQAPSYTDEKAADEDKVEERI